MKIGIFSDAHGSMAAVEQVYAIAPDCALWLYAGDVASDAHYLETLAGAGATVRSCRHWRLAESRQQRPDGRSSSRRRGIASSSRTGTSTASE